MSLGPIKAPPQVIEILDNVRNKFHPHLEQAKIAVEFVATKAYVKNEINLGQVKKFGKAAKLWMPLHEKYDFLISLCTDVWYDILNNDQREALLDLLVSRCQVEMLPNVVVENGKNKVVKNQHGLIEYTDQMKTDDEGFPVWKKLPLNIGVISQNIKRYGIWYDDLLVLKEAVEQHG